MPTRCIHSRSSLMPSWVTLPFIQCHQTRGFAELGGFRNPRSSASPEPCPRAPPARLASPTIATSRIIALHAPLIPHLLVPQRPVDGLLSIRRQKSRQG